MKIYPSLLPLALRGSLGNPFHGGDLSKAEAAKEAEIDNLGERSITPGEFVQGIADACQFAVIRHILIAGTKRCDLEVAAAFLGMAPAGVIDNQAAHDAQPLTRR